MGSSKPCSRWVTVKMIDARRQSYYFMVLIKTPPVGSGLRPFPGSIHRSAITDELDQTARRLSPERTVQLQGQLLQPAERASTQTQSSDSSKFDQAIEALNQSNKSNSELVSTLLQLEAARAQRHDEACRSLELAAQKMTVYMEANLRRQKLKDERKERDRKMSLELQKAAGVAKDPHFNWMFGHGISPKTGRRATTKQTQFDRVKTVAKQNALWFTQDATEHELKPPFIQFNDTPRVGIDGIYIKKLMMDEVDATDHFAKSLVRVLRRDESLRYKGSQGDCHYVVHTWAQKVSLGAPIEELENHFKQPTLGYALAGCNKVVAFVALDDGWASISMDFNKTSAHLIHPTVAPADPETVLAKHLGWMMMLTTAAQAHMEKLAGFGPLQKEWDFAVLLKGGQPLPPNYSGVATAFYSIPKDDQFVIVSDETLLLAKQTFLYSLMLMCQPITKQKLRKAKSKRPKYLKRGPDGELKLTDIQSRGDSGETSKAASHDPLGLGF